MKKQKRSFGLSSLSEIIEYFKENSETAKIRITNYSTKAETENTVYFFSEEKPNKQVFQFYNKMKSDVSGEYRNVKRDFKYFDFSGVKRCPEAFYCVDINSAYLTVLKNESIISEETYKYILEKSKGKNKPDRLKAVGMFAKNPVEVFLHRGKVFSIKGKKDPFEWVFYLAVRETYLAMKEAKKEIGKDFLFYWVDGIFTKGNPGKIVEILKNLGFESKIEKIEKFEIKDGAAYFLKDGKEKMLFLPKSQKEEKIDFLKTNEKYL